MYSFLNIVIKKSDMFSQCLLDSKIYNSLRQECLIYSGEIMPPGEIMSFGVSTVNYSDSDSAKIFHCKFIFQS